MDIIANNIFVIATVGKNATTIKETVADHGSVPVLFF